MKEAGYDHWQYFYYNYDSRSGVATNSSGFTALPGGYRDDPDGTYFAINQIGYFWSSTSIYTQYAYACLVQKDVPIISTWAQGRWKGVGYSIRCIKD